MRVKHKRSEIARARKMLDGVLAEMFGKENIRIYDRRDDNDAIATAVADSIDEMLVPVPGDDAYIYERYKRLVSAGFARFDRMFAVIDRLLAMAIESGSSRYTLPTEIEAARAIMAVSDDGALNWLHAYFRSLDEVRA